MNNIWKRSLSMLLALVMVMGMLPMGALAEELEASACEHAYAAGETFAPTCTEAGYTVYTCGLCGDSYEDAAEALGHDWGVWEVNEDETSEQRACAVCGETETNVFEIEAVEEVVAEEVMAAAVTDANQADALIWLDANRQDDLIAAIGNNELDDIVLKALGVTGTVKYDGVNVGDFLDLLRNQEKVTVLKDAIKAHELITFTVAKGSSVKDYKIAFRNVQNAAPVVTMNGQSTVTISGKTAPADLEAQILAARDSAVVTLEYHYESGSISIHETIPHKLAKAETSISEINTTWPAPEKTADAAVVTLTIKDDLNGQSTNSGSAKVVLENTTQVYDIVYTDGGEGVFESVVYSVVEGQAVPVYTPAHVAFNGWDKEVPAVAEADVTLAAQWIKHTVTYTDGIDDAEAFPDQVFTVLKGAKTPAYAVKDTYNGRAFSSWSPAVAATVTGEATYTAQWAVDDSLLVTYYCDVDDLNDFFTNGLLSGGTAWNYGEDYMAVEGKLFQGWHTREEVEGEFVYTPWAFDTQVTENLSLYALYLEDSNNNRIPDIEEGAVITLPADIDVKDVSVKTLNGVPTIVIADMGSIAVPGMKVETIDDQDVYKFLGEGTTITVKPNVDKDTGISNTYVKAITINGVAQELNYQDDFSVVQTLTNKTRAAAKFQVEVQFAWADIEEASSINLMPGKEYSAEDIYDAAVSFPAREAGDEVTVLYKARDIREVSVDVSGLKDLIEEYEDIAKSAGYDIDLDAAYDELVGADGLYEVELTEKWLDYTDAPAGIAKTAQDVVNEYIAELKANPMDLITRVMKASNVDALMDELEAEMQAELDVAEIEPFAYNPNPSATKDDISETIKVTYKGDEMYAVSNAIALTIEDDRAYTEISISQKSFVKTYGFNPDEILGKITVKANGEEIDVDLSHVDLASLNVGTYKAVRVSFAGNEDLKPCSTTFDLTINKGTATVSVPRIIVEHGDLYDPAPTVKPAGAEYIQVIVGMDMTEADIDLSKADLTLNGQTLPVSAYVKNVRPKAWIKVPQSIKNLLENRGIDTTKENTFTLDEIETILNSNADFLAKFSVTQEHLNYLFGFMNTIEKVADVNLSVSFDDKAVPYDSGVYINAAVVTDGNYNMAYDANILLVQPVIGMPNQGGVQLFLEENGKMVVENIFERPNTGNPYALGVAYKGEKVYDATVYYYGLTAGLAVHYTTVAPSEPGVYAAATVYTTMNDQGKEVTLGGDTAIIIIGLERAFVEIPTVEAVKYDGQPHKATITVEDKDGNAINDAALTIITGTAGADNMSANIAIKDIKANANIDFPAALDNAWPTFVEYAAKLGATYPADITKAEAAPEDILMFLNWCDEQIDNVALQLKDNKYTDKAEQILSTSYANKVFDSTYWGRIESADPTGLLSKMGAPEEFIAEIQKHGHSVIARIRTEITPMLEALPEDVTVSFRNNVQFTEKGIYLYAAIITDPEYIPDADAGVLVITTDKNYYMLDTTVPYDGNPHTPDLINETGREGVDMYIDMENKLINFNMTEKDADAFIARVQDKFNAKFGTNVEVRGKSITVRDLYANAEEQAKLRIEDVIVDRIEDFVVAHFNSEGRLNEQQILDKIAECVTRFGNLKTKISNKIQNHENYTKWEDFTIVVNGDMPVNPGEYHFYGVSYDVDATDAILTIIPAEIVVTAPSDTITVGDEYELVLQIQVKDAEGNLVDLDPTSPLYQKITASYTMYDADGNETFLPNAIQTAGAYDIKVSATCSEDADKATISAVDGVLTVEPAEVIGTISKGEWKMELDSVIFMNYYPTIEGFPDDFDFANRGGVVVWVGEENPTGKDDLMHGKANTITLEGMKWNETTEKWYVQTPEIFAKNIGDIVYIRPYVKTADGEYVYMTSAVGHSPARFCYDVMDVLSEDLQKRHVCAALLEYGASAQVYFDYDTGNMVNIIPSGWPNIKMEEYKLEYSDAYLDDLDVPANAADLVKTMTGVNDGSVIKGKQTLDLQGAIRMSVGFDLNIKAEDIVSAKVMFWSEDDIKNVTSLAYEDKTYTTICDLTEAVDEEVNLGMYRAKSHHILAKNLSDTVYYYCIVETADNVYRSGLILYSPEMCVSDHLTDSITGQVDIVAQRIAVYSEMALRYFGK